MACAAGLAPRPLAQWCWAAQVRAKYGQPLKAVVIRDSGVLPIREPFLWQG